MDINEKLDSLIVQYKIDRFHPRFAKAVRAKQLLAEFFENYKGQEIVIIAHCSTDAYCIQEDCGLRDKCKVLLYSQLENYSWSEIENSVVVIVSFYGRREMLSLLYNAGVTAVSVYDYFAEKGLFLEGNYYDIFGEEYHIFKGGKCSFDYADLDMNAIFFYDRRSYEIAEKLINKEMYLTKMIFDCVYIKDWKLVKKYIEEYAEHKFSYSFEYQNFYQEIKCLLADIKEALKARNQKDIIIFWLDALEYGEDRDMPFLRSLSSESLDFVNAYTVTPYTHPTTKALFLHKCVVDDRTYKVDIDKENSPFLKMIEEQGFHFLFYTKLEQVPVSLKGRLCQNSYTPFAEICWNMIHDILKSKKKICAVCHEILQTHSPCISYGLSGKEYVCARNGSKILSVHESKVIDRQRLESRKYTDDVLCMYSELFPDDVYKIYMSDHGHTALGRWHTIFRIAQKDIVPRRVEDLFSYVNFDKLIYKVIRNEKDYSDIIENYAQIQDVDYYNKTRIQLYLQNVSKDLSVSLESLFGYKGIVTRQHTYIRYNDGRERYYNNDFNAKPLLEEDIGYLRTLCTEYPQDIITDEQFKYTRNVYATVRNYWNRNGEWERKKIQEIMALFDALPDATRVAIRGGGLHTVELWFILKQKQQEKIEYIIDTDKKCAAARLGLKVITIEDIDQNEIDMILVSSFKYEAEWSEELKKNIRQIPVIGLYKWLKERGIECKTEFYKKEYTEEDIVWEE